MNTPHKRKKRKTDSYGFVNESLFIYKRHIYNYHITIKFVSEFYIIFKFNFINNSYAFLKFKFNLYKKIS